MMTPMVPDRTGPGAWHPSVADGFGAKGIAPFGPIDDNAGDAFGSLVKDVGI
jgi:hypothetical protein